MKAQTDFFVRLMFLGEATVGKTSILQQFVKSIFHKRPSHTIGIDYFNKDVMVDDKSIRLQIWDTAGQE